MKKYTIGMFLFISIAGLYAATGSSSRYYSKTNNYHDYMGREVWTGSYYVIYDFTTISGIEGRSDIFKYQDKFSERFDEIIMTSDAFFTGHEFQFQVGEQLPLTYSPSTLKKAGLDGISFRLSKKENLIKDKTVLQNFELTGILSRMSDPVVSSIGDWEELAKTENDFLFAASLAFKARPLYLYLLDSAEKGSANYSVKRKINLFELEYLRINFVDQFHSISTNDSPDLRGVNGDAAPSELYIKISSLAGGINSGAVRLYSRTGKFITVKEDLQKMGGTADEIISLHEGTPDTFQDENNNSSYQIKNGESITLKITLPPSSAGDWQYISNITASIDIAGSYIVQASTRGQFESTGEGESIPTDAVLFDYVKKTSNDPFANRRWRTFPVSRITSLFNTSAVFKMNLFDILNLSGEVALSTRNMKYPGAAGSYRRLNGTCLDLGALIKMPESSFFCGSLLGRWHNVSPGYINHFSYNSNRYYSVDDNDNRNTIEGKLSGVPGSTKRGEKIELSSLIDVNQNNTVDAEEDIVRIDALPPLLYGRTDRNNNMEFDEIEDDNTPDRPHYSGSTGFDINIDTAISGKTALVGLSGGYLRDALFISEGYQEEKWLALGFSFFPSTALKMNTLYTHKLVKDSISDDRLNTDGTQVVDPMLCLDSRVQTLLFDSQLKIKQILFQIKSIYLQNAQLMESNTIQISGISGRLEYKRDLHEKLSLKAVHSISGYEKKTELEKTGFDELSLIEQNSAGIFTLKLGAIFDLDAIGAIYNRYDRNDPLKNYVQKSLMLQLHGDFMFQRVPMYAMIAGGYNSRKYQTPDSVSGRNDSDNFILNVRLLSRY